MQHDPLRADIFRQDVDLPLREFMFTLDQIAYMLDLDEEYLKKKLLFLPGRSTGRQGGRIRCTNIARPDQNPNWRVSELNFKLWLQARGIRYREPAPLRKPRSLPKDRS